MSVTEDGKAYGPNSTADDRMRLMAAAGDTLPWSALVPKKSSHPRITSHPYILMPLRLNRIVVLLKFMVGSVSSASLLSQLDFASLQPKVFFFFGTSRSQRGFSKTCWCDREWFCNRKRFMGLPQKTIYTIMHRPTP